MKKINALLLLILPLVIGMSISGCKKFEEGPSISLHTKKHRVVGTWVVEKVLETPYHGSKIDRTGDYKAYYANFVWTFTKDDRYTVTFNPASVGTYNEPGEWDLAGDKTNLRLFPDNGNGSFIGSPWKILRLKEKELWMEITNNNGDVIEAHFMPQ